MGLWVEGLGWGLAGGVEVGFADGVVRALDAVAGRQGGG
jgi:hypothetical protein